MSQDSHDGMKDEEAQQIATMVACVLSAQVATELYASAGRVAAGEVSSRQHLQLCLTVATDVATTAMALSGLYLSQDEKFQQEMIELFKRQFEKYLPVKWEILRSDLPTSH